MSNIKKYIFADQLGFLVNSVWPENKTTDTLTEEILEEALDEEMEGAIESQMKYYTTRATEEEAEATKHAMAEKKTVCFRFSTEKNHNRSSR